MLIMSYVNFCTITIFLYLLKTGESEMPKWLTLGEKFSKYYVPPEIGLLSEESLFFVTKMKNVEIETKEKRIITSVIAASMFMHGYVIVVNGGINHTKIEVLYASENSYPDTLYIHIQSAWHYPGNAKKNVGKISVRPYEQGRRRSWSIGELRAVFLHGNSTKFTPEETSQPKGFHDHNIVT
uniref:Venom protein n=1 Tax=Ampulex compressa TaxID=860918 RepID=A0A1W6EW30_AMPCP|nr:venom protein [Ampulex compressa]